MPEIQLRRVGDSGFFLLPAEVATHGSPQSWVEAPLLIDTGASGLFLGDQFVRSIGYEPGPPRFRTGGLTGGRELASVRDLGVRLGGGVPVNLYFEAVPVLPRESGLPANVAGIAGFALFQRLRATLTVDYDTNLATLSWP